MSEVVTLEAEPMSVGLVPRIGGSISHFRFDGTDVMRPLSAADLAAGNVLGVAAFPMLPYANRIAGNAFEFRGQTFRFEANNPPEKYNVHGTGWKRPWAVEAQSATEALLTLVVDEAPYGYRASQQFVLEPERLTVEMSISNTGPIAMPFGIGLHPWFNRDSDVTVQFAARKFYLELPEHVAGDAISLPPELDYASPGPLPRGWRNNDYGGWAGVATVTFPGRGLALTMRAEPIFGHLMIYADPRRPFFCIEPQTNASGAFNRPDAFSDPEQGVIVLEPGESAGGTMWFEVARL